MKKSLYLVTAAFMLIGVLAGCGSGGDEGAEQEIVNVYNWGEYIDESLLSRFEEETGITVNYKTYETNEMLYSVLKQGGVSYDVIIPSDYMVSRLIEEGMLEKIDFSNVPNMELIDGGLDRSYDPTGEYSVPYMWGTVGIIYNGTEISEEITSWSALFDEAYSGQILMFDNSRDAMGIALKYLGHSVNTTDVEELDEAFELLSAQKSVLQGYVMDQIYDKLESGVALIGPYYAGDYLSMLENNPDLKFVVPQEGSNVFVDAMCIPVFAENKANAEAFINFMSGTEVSMANAAVTGYTSPNEEVEAQIELGDLERAVMYPADDVLERCEAFVNLPEEILEMYNDYWVRVKS